jgi:hypothetical protein
MGALCECLKRYLLAQRVVVPAMIITIATALVAPLYNWLLLFKWVAATPRHSDAAGGRYGSISCLSVAASHVVWALQECGWRGLLRGAVAPHCKGGMPGVVVWGAGAAGGWCRSQHHCK